MKRLRSTNLWFTKLPEIAILLLATITRAWRLGYHSIWFDEAVSIHWAKADLQYMWRATFLLVEEKHPPIYYTYLKLWHGLLEQFDLHQSDALLRASGVPLGVLTVLGIMLLARRASGRPTALLTGLLVSLSPILIWYSQEIRMFQPAATAIVWTAYFMHAAWYRPTLRQRVPWWIAALVCLSLALYMYLYVPFILPVAGLTLLGLALLQKRWQPFFEGGITLALAALIFLPLALNAWGISTTEGTNAAPFTNFVPNTQKIFKIFTIWKENWAEFVVSGSLIYLAILLLLGLIVPWTIHAKEANHQQIALRAGRSFDQWWLCSWIIGTLVVANIMLFSSGSIFREDRYLIFMVPFVLWAIARGAIVLAAYVGSWRSGKHSNVSTPSYPSPARGRNQHGIDNSHRENPDLTSRDNLLPYQGRIKEGSTLGPSRYIATILALIPALLLAATLPRLWTPDLFRENWRAAANYIEAYQQASPTLSSAGVAHINYTHQPLEWYLRTSYSFDELPVYGLFGNPITPERIEPDVAPPLLGIRKELGSATLWLTQSHLEGVDDARLVEEWLNQQYPTITEQYPTGIKLTGYALQTRFDSLPELSASAVYPNAELAPGLTLAACEITTPVVAARDVAMHPPSGWVHVRIWWQATGPIAENYLATAQVIGEEGVWGAQLNRDWLPPESEALRRFPTSSWQAGEIIRNELDINLNPATPARNYPIVIGVQNSAGEVVGSTAECGRVTIQ